MAIPDQSAKLNVCQSVFVTNLILGECTAPTVCNDHQQSQ